MGTCLWKMRSSLNPFFKWWNKWIPQNNMINYMTPQILTNSNKNLEPLAPSYLDDRGLKCHVWSLSFFPHNQVIGVCSAHTFIARPFLFFPMWNIARPVFYIPFLQEATLPTLWGFGKIISWPCHGHLARELWVLTLSLQNRLIGACNTHTCTSHTVRLKYPAYLSVIWRDWQMQHEIFNHSPSLLCHIN